jgi:hypothetical protein
MGTGPVDLTLGGVSIAPVIVALLLGLVAAVLLTALASHLGLARFVWHPPLFFAALLVVCTLLVGSTWVPAFFG